MRVTIPTSLQTTHERNGAVLVENALVISFFAVFLAGILEFGHCYLVINTLNVAAKRAARYGACEGITTSQVRTRCEEVLNESFDASAATILVKDAGVFDTGASPDSIDYSSLPNIELSTAQPRQLFVIRISVPYESVALIPPFWVQGATLHGQSVMRHE